MKTKGYSPFLTWNLSEFNRLRFQYSYLDDKVREEKADSGASVFPPVDDYYGSSYAWIPRPLEFGS